MAGCVNAAYAAGVPCIYACDRAVARILEPAVVHPSRQWTWSGIILFGGVALLTLAAPFELTAPLVRLPRQSVSNARSGAAVAFVGWGAAIVVSRRLPQWRTPLTLPWVALLVAMVVASAASPVSRDQRAPHDRTPGGGARRVSPRRERRHHAPRGCGRRSRSPSPSASSSACSRSSSISACRPVLAWLDGVPARRRDGRRAGARRRTAAVPDDRVDVSRGRVRVRPRRAAGRARRGASATRRASPRCSSRSSSIGEAITLTFTRAGLITMAASLLLRRRDQVVAARRRRGTRGSSPASRS